MPEAYVVALASGSDRHTHSEAELALQLRQAADSNRPAVLVDCRLLETLSPTAARLLRRLHHCLGLRQARLVLCHVSDALVSSLQAANAVPPSGYVVADSLDQGLQASRN